MPLHTYAASRYDGHMVRGVADANDIHHLAHLLEEDHLFLICARIEPLSLPAAPVTIPLISQAAWRTELFELHRRSPMRTWLLLGALGFAIVLRLPSANSTYVPSAGIFMKTEQIKPGWTRHQVEQLLTRYGKGETSEHTRYLEAKEALIDVDYDSTGGPWNPQNRVVGPARVHVNLVWHKGRYEPASP